MKVLQKEGIAANKAFVVSCILTIPFILLLSYHLYSRIGAFGCFDDCTVFAAGHFLLLGRKMYSEIFFNHQMLMPYISAMVQYIFQPESLYQLVLYHRGFIMLFSWFSMTAIVWRFRWSGLLFILLYEPLKFYYFGDRFLPESLIVYMLVYILGLIWIRIDGKTLRSYDYYTAALLSSLVVLLREPYVPIALVMFAILVLKYPLKNSHIKSIVVFVLLTSIVYLVHPLKDYIDTVILLNAEGVASSELESNNIFGTGIIQVLLYPIYTLFKGHVSFLRFFLVIYSLIFICLSIIIGVIFKKPRRIVLMWLLLALIGIRTVSPGYQYYEAFHMAPWMGMFTMSIGLFVVSVAKRKKYYPTMVGISVGIILLAFIAVFHPKSFTHTQISAQDEFEVGYSNYQEYINYINVLKEPNDTLFVDKWDDIMYWGTELDSSYQYGLYTPWNQSIERYELAKFEMMSSNPPQIYYCSEGFNYENKKLLSEISDAPYTQLQKDAEDICLYIHNDKLLEFSVEQLEQFKTQGITFKEKQ